jgi:phosphohistidine phosphatase
VRLYLVRHATAADIAPSDAARELTPTGLAEARIAGQALAKLGVTPDRILTSPLLRARQTAAALQLTGEIQALDELANGHSTAELLRALAPWTRARELVLIGHLPSLADHLAVLLGVSSPGNLTFGKASVACLECALLVPGKAELRWFLSQPQLRTIAG